MKKRNPLNKQIDKYNAPDSHERAKQLAEIHKNKKVTKFDLK